MAIRRFGVELGHNKAVAEAEDVTATEISDAAAVTGVDAVSGAVDAINAIGTSQGTAAIRVLINDAGTPTLVDVVRGLEAILAHIRASNTYA